MPQAVLLAIKPEFAEKILAGEKTYEYRRTLFKRSEINRVVIYATSPVSLVVGEFEIDEIIALPMRALWKTTNKSSGITWKYFADYFRGKKTCHAIKVTNPKRYKQMIQLTDAVGLKKPPQSFAYVDVGVGDR